MVCGVLVYNVLSDGMSSFHTLSAGLQALAFLLLVIKVQGKSSVSGISTKMLKTYIVTLVFRLASTLTQNGYLPADATGDWMYQCEELLSLFLAACLLQKVLYVRRVSFAGATQDDHDSLPGFPAVVLVCMILAWTLHP